MMPSSASETRLEANWRAGIARRFRQHLADRTLAVIDTEALRDDLLQADATPAHAPWIARSRLASTIPASSTNWPSTASVSAPWIACRATRRGRSR